MYGVAKAFCKLKEIILTSVTQFFKREFLNLNSQYDWRKFRWFRIVDDILSPPGNTVSCYYLNTVPEILGKNWSINLDLSQYIKNKIQVYRSPAAYRLKHEEVLGCLWNWLRIQRGETKLYRTASVTNLTWMSIWTFYPYLFLNWRRERKAEFPASGRSVLTRHAL